MSQLDLRPRSTSDIIDSAFVLYRANPGQYLMLSAMAAAPGLLLNLFLMNGKVPETPGDLVNLIPGFIIGLITYSLSSGVIQRIGSRAFLGEESDVATTVREVIPLIPSMLGAMLLVMLASILAFICFIIPVFWVLSKFFAVSSVIAIEKAGIADAFERSSRLTKNQKWHVFVTLILVYAISWVLSLGVALFARMLPGSGLPLVVSTAFAILVQPVLLLTTMLLYYDLRIRNEGFDVEHMSRSLGAAGPSADAAAY